MMLRHLRMPRRLRRSTVFVGPAATLCSLLVLSVLSILSAPSARAARVFYDSFESKTVGQNLNGLNPEEGTGAYSVRGTGNPVIARRNNDSMADMNLMSYISGLVLFGPTMGSERWIRFDLPAGDAANPSVPVLIPQVQTGAETNAASLPAIWPAGAAADPWVKVNIGFAGWTGGTTSPTLLDLGALYPNCQRTVPFHLEIHWRIDTPTQATLEMRIWNGDSAPAYAAGARATYVLNSGTWATSARSAITGVGGHGYVSAISLYESVPGESRLVPATDAGLSYSGRWATVNTSERHASSAGSRVRFVVTGSQCYLRVRGTGDAAKAPPLNIRVDGGAWTRVEPSSASDYLVQVFDGDLPTASHAVEVLVSATEPGDPWATQTSRFMLQGLSIAQNGTVTPLPYPSRKVVFLGDDISTGHLVLLQALNAGPNGRNEARLAAPTFVADWLGVDVINALTPGIGFLAPAGAATALPFLQNVLQGVPWQPEAAPEAVLVNLGTNDSNTGTYPDATLRTAVSDYLKAVRAKFPQARLFMLRPFNGSRESVLHGAFNSVADPNSVWVDTTGWLDLTQGRDTSDGTHPNTSGSVKYAQHVIDLLSTYFATLPTSQITSPQANATVSGTVPVRGNANGYAFTGYRLEVGRGDAPTSWTLLSDGTAPVFGDVLGQWNTAGLAGGRYTLRLTVIANEKIAITTTSVTVGGAKPGDIDANGTVTLADAALALKIAGGLASVTSAQMPLADVAPATLDARVTAADAAAIAKLALTNP